MVGQGMKENLFIWAGFRIRIRCFCLNPDSVFKFVWTRFQPPDHGAKKECRKGSKRYLLEENFMTKENVQNRGSRLDLEKILFVLRGWFRIWIRI